VPAIQRGEAYRLRSGGWGLRYYNAEGRRRRKSPFPTKSAALAHFRNEVEPRLRGETPLRELTVAELIYVYLERHAAIVRTRTIETLGERLLLARRAFGEVPLRDLERMSGEIASWQAALPERSRYGVVQAFRQTLEAGVRWGYMSQNPAKLAGRNPQPPPRTVRVFTPSELEALAAELDPRYRPLIRFVAATGLRPEEWQALERRDILDAFVSVSRTVSGGQVVELAKTNAGRRQVPLNAAARDALAALPPRLDTPLLFPAPGGGLINLDNFRRRTWAPAVEASGVVTPARLYDLRSTYASESLAAGVSIFKVARVMGTSVRMIERAYGTLLDGAGAEIVALQDAYDAARASGPIVARTSPEGGR
jgi:integrase